MLSPDYLCSILYSLQPSSEERIMALIAALSDILWKLGRQQKATVALPPSHPQHSARVPSRSYTPDHLTERVYWQYTDNILTIYWQYTDRILTVHWQDTDRILSDDTDRILKSQYTRECILHVFWKMLHVILPKKWVINISLREKCAWEAKEWAMGTIHGIPSAQRKWRSCILD